MDSQQDSGLNMLDSGVPENNENEELIWQRRKEDDDRERELDGLLCVGCRTHSKDKTQNPDSLLCEECRSQYSKLSVPVWVIGFLAAIFAILILSSLRLPSVISTYKTYLKAEEQSKNMQYSFSMSNYFSVLEEYNDSVPIIMETIDTAMKSQYFDGAAYILDTYLMGKELNDAQYQKATQISGLLEKYYDTLERCQNLFETVNDADELTPKLMELLEEADIDKTYVLFLLGSISSDEAQGLHYLQLACEQDERFTYPLSFYGNALRRNGDIQPALDVYTDALGKNACDAIALKGIGIIELLQGNMEQGMETIQTAYDMDPYALYMSEAMVIAYCENGRRDDALAIIEEKTAEGYEFDEDMDEYLDNKITLAQYYMQ